MTHSLTPPAQAQPFFAVRYVYAEGTHDLRDQHRPEHLAFLQGLFDAGILVVSGPTSSADGNAGALLIIRASTAEHADDLMAADPFALHGFVHRVVARWEPKFGAARLEMSSPIIKEGA